MFLASKKLVCIYIAAALVFAYSRPRVYSLSGPCSGAAPLSGVTADVQRSDIDMLLGLLLGPFGVSKLTLGEL